MLRQAIIPTVPAVVPQLMNELMAAVREEANRAPAIREKLFQVGCVWAGPSQQGLQLYLNQSRC